MGDDDSRDLDIITDWSYNTGSFPLTDSVLQRMMDGLTEIRPKYYFAMAILLHVRAVRTPKQEEAFQKLKKLWEEEWFTEKLEYAALKSGAPQSGRCAYTAEQREWCDIRLGYLAQAITDQEVRTRIGIPSRKSGTSAVRIRGGTASIERSDDSCLLDAAGEKEPAPASSRGAAEDGANQDALAVLAAAANTVGADAGTVKSPQSASLSSQAETPDRLQEGTKLRKKRRSSRKLSGAVAPAAEDAATADGLSPGQRGTRNEQGKVVSVKDGRPLKEGNDLKRAFSNNYRDDQNTRKFYGRSLTLGEAFKLAVVCQHGHTLPTDRSGHLESRIALFRTAAYYALSMDGEDERNCRQSPDFPDFLYFLVQSAKQMRYGWLTRARVYFGKNVFGVKPPTQRHRSKCCIISN